VIERSRRLVGVGVVVIVLAMLGPVVAASASGAAATGGHGVPAAVGGPMLRPLRALPALGVRPVLDQQFAGTDSGYTVGAHGASVLSGVIFSNQTFGLVLSNASTNTSRVLPGNAGIAAGYPESIVAAGDKFFLSALNFSSNTVSFYQISFSGTVLKAALPLGSHLPWTFPYGNATALFASEVGFLVELNPATHAIIQNFSHDLPARLAVLSLVPSGPSLYLAGTLANPNATSSSAYFGVLNATTGKLVRISPIRFHPADYYGYFDAVGIVGGLVYVGGGLEYFNTATFNFSTPQGYLDRYDPSTGTYVNRTFTLPVPNEWILSIEPWKTAALLVAGGYEYTATTSVNTFGIYSLSPTGGLVNRSARLPAGFIGNNTPSAASDGYVFLEGYNTLSGLAELVGIPG